jgi:hypothetical protein
MGWPSPSPTRAQAPRLARRIALARKETNARHQKVETGLPGADPFTHAQQAGVIALKARLPFRMARNQISTGPDRLMQV